MYFMLTILFIVLILVGLFILKIRSNKNVQNEIDETVLNPVSNSLPGINSNKAEIFHDAFVYGEATIHYDGLVTRPMPSRTPPRPQQRLSSSRPSRSNQTSQSYSQNSFRSNDEDDYLRRVRETSILSEIVNDPFESRSENCCESSYQDFGTNDSGNTCSDYSSSSSYDSGSSDCGSSDSGSCSCSD